jgi:uncharacterized membrane protein
LAIAAALLLAVGTSSTDPTPATLLAVLAFVISTAAATGIGRSSLSGLRERSLVTVLAVGIGLEVVVGILAPAVLDARFMLLFGIAGAIGLYTLFAPASHQRLGLLLVVAIHFGLMLWMFAAVPLRNMDVHLVQQEASAALLAGVNPYSITFENMYGYGTPLYPIEVQEGDRVTFGFPYPPLSLLMAIPGFAVFGDYRVSALVAVSITAILVGTMRKGTLSAGAALIVLFSPLTARVLHNGWTEPFVAVLLAATVYLAVRRVAAMPLALGLLVATKQYAVVLLPIAMGLLTDARSRVGPIRMFVLAASVACLTALPFLLWDPERFIFSTVVLQTFQPLREDGATLAALLTRMGMWVPPAWVGLALVAALILVVLRKAKATPSGFSIAAAVVLIGLFLLSRSAFMNYYFLATIALLCSVAATELEDTASAAEVRRSGPCAARAVS